MNASPKIDVRTSALYLATTNTIAEELSDALSKERAERTIIESQLEQERRQRSESTCGVKQVNECASEIYAKRWRHAQHANQESEKAQANTTTVR